MSLLVPFTALRTLRALNDALKCFSLGMHFEMLTKVILPEELSVAD
jgi:hypothetical protein